MGEAYRKQFDDIVELTLPHCDGDMTLSLLRNVRNDIGSLLILYMSYSYLR